MPLTTPSDLRIIIGEDEQLLAIDLAQELEELGASIVGCVARVEELEDRIAAGLDGANAALLDIELLDGSIIPVVPRLLRAGISVVFCSGYQPQERPDELAHIPWIGKPARTEDIARTLCLAVDAQKERQID